MAVLGFCFLFIVALTGSLSRADQSLCDHVILKEGHLKLDKNEKILICGTPKATEGWREVPLPQAQYQLNVLAQNLGYLSARFERKDQELYLWLGPRQMTKKLIVEGADGLLNANKKRKIVDFAMEPARLDEVQHWAELNLRRKGYACPQVKVTAQQWDGTILVQIQTGQRGTIRSLKETGLESLESSTLRRFQAFKLGQVYDVVDTDLTANRMLVQGLFQSAYITDACDGDQVDLHLITSLGKPRLFRFGFGASTEEFPFADLWFKNTQLDNKASSFTATLHGSNRLQNFNINSELYWLPFTKRTFLGPRLSIGRDNENSYEFNQAKAGIDLGRAWDAFGQRLQLRLGPSLNALRTVRGIGPSDQFLSWEGTLQTSTHAYEEFYRDQDEGWTASLNYRLQRADVGSNLNVDRYQADVKHLWNIGGYSPPLFVLATRAEVIAVNSTVRDPLPEDYRIFYGGDDNLRGFSRQSLNNVGVGYLTAAYLGFELRLIEELPFHLQPFLLYDFAELGQNAMTLDPGYFTSPGLGMRWASPFGTLRFSAAQGRILAQNQTTVGIPEQWNLFVSFGTEF